MGKLLSDNKTLTDKLAAAQKEIDSLKSNPKSKLAMAQAQLKNLQDQYEASQEANKALQDTTTTLKPQLDQAQADLVAANQKLAAAGTGSPEYDTLKRENEIMRDILTRELQEQAHRDMAKRLAQEEYDNLKLKSKVLQEQLDILGSPMTPPTNDQERALLASLKVPGPDVSPRQLSPMALPRALRGTTPPTDQATTTTPPATPDASAPIPTWPRPRRPPPTRIQLPPRRPRTTNSVAGTTPPATTPDATTNQPPVNIVMNTPSPGRYDRNDPSDNDPCDEHRACTSSPSATAPATPPAVAAAPDATSKPPTTPRHRRLLRPSIRMRPSAERLIASSFGGGDHAGALHSARLPDTPTTTKSRRRRRP